MTTNETKMTPRWVTVLYWMSTGLIGAMMAMSSVMYLTSAEMAANFHQLGFRDSFRIELGIAKGLGTLALLAPVPSRLKEWAYAGFTITFVSAIILHVSRGDPAKMVAMPVIALGLLMTSYAMFRRRPEAAFAARASAPMTPIGSAARAA